MFSGCTSLKTYAGSTDSDGDFSNYTIPSGVTNMRLTFGMCQLLNTAPVIPNSVTWIGRFAFINCTNLKSVTMLDGDNVITYFGDNSFSNCTNLTSIRLSSAVQSMQEQSFYNCKNLTSIYIPASVKRIDARNNGNGFFDGCQKTLKIYCEVDSKQEGWGEYWNYCDYRELTVEWGVTREQYEKIISQIQE